MNKDNYTIIDLGSNSFHMLTVCSVDNGFSVVDKSKQKVRLAAGLNDQQELNQETMEIGWGSQGSSCPVLPGIIGSNRV